MATIFFNNKVSPHIAISNNCSEPEKITKYVVSEVNRPVTYYAYSHKKKPFFYELRLVDGTTIEINEGFIISKTPMLLITIVTNIEPWKNYNKKVCNTCIETRKFAILTKDKAEMTTQNNASPKGFERVETIIDET